MNNGVIDRTQELTRIREGLVHWPVTVLLGPRQCGKTFLVRNFATSLNHYFDLHALIDRTRLEDTGFKILDGLEGVVVIDEAQEMPQLLRQLRVLADRPGRTTRFLLTGSASPHLSKETAESLTGRARLLSLNGFNVEEAGTSNWERLWLRGGFPRFYLDDPDSLSWERRQHYLSQILERDIPALVDTRLRPEQLRRLALLLAHHHGQYWNHSEIASVLGITGKTVQRYIEVFKGLYLLRELAPYHENLGKRLRKAPKLYWRDSGLLHALLGIRDITTLYGVPQLGASWEGFVIEQFLTLARLPEQDVFTWSVQSGAEVDLVVRSNGQLFGIECKASAAPTRTRAMTASIESLGLNKLYVVYPGEKSFSIGDDIKIVPMCELPRIITEITKSP
jgi:predicted AAA+ superfamily ATPase